MATTQLEEIIRKILPVDEKTKQEVKIELKAMAPEQMPIGSGTTSHCVLATLSGDCIEEIDGASKLLPRKLIAKCYDFEENGDDERVKHLFRNELQFFSKVLPLARDAADAQSIVPKYIGTYTAAASSESDHLPHVILFEYLEGGHFPQRDAVLSKQQIAAVACAYKPMLKYFLAENEVKWEQKFGDFDLLEYIKSGIKGLVQEALKAAARQETDDSSDSEDETDAEAKQRAQPQQDMSFLESTAAMQEAFTAVFPNIVAGARIVLDSNDFDDILAKLDKLLSEDILANILTSAYYLIDGPVSVFHGDMQPTNLFFPSDTSKLPRLIDWQAVGLGNPLFDVVRLATQSAADLNELKDILENVVIGELSKDLLEPEVARKSLDSLLWCELCTYIGLTCTPVFLPYELNGGFDRVLRRGMERTIDLLLEKQK